MSKLQARPPGLSSAWLLKVGTDVASSLALRISNFVAAGGLGHPCGLGLGRGLPPQSEICASGPFGSLPWQVDSFLSNI